MADTSISREPGPARLSSVRRHNLGLVLGALRMHGPMSRAGLAARTGLTKVTLSSLATELLERELVREEPLQHEQGQSGRPSRPLALNPNGAAGLGLWIDVDRLGVCLTDMTGRPRFRKTVRRDNSRARPATVLRHLVRLAGEAFAAAPELQARTVAATLSVPGLVDTSRRHLHIAPNLDWSDLPLSAQLAPMLADLLPDTPPPMIANEANAAANAERTTRLAASRVPDGSGAAGGPGASSAPGTNDNFLFVTLGFGVGAGVVQDGALFRGARGFGGELGHSVVQPKGPRCACGNRGCLEALVGRDALLERARVRLGSALPCDDDPEIVLDALHRLANDGNSGAAKVLGETAGWLAVALTNYANLLDPQAIVLGGYGARFADSLIPTIKQHLKQNLLSARWAPCDVLPAISGPEAALVGAGLLALERVFEKPDCLSRA